MDFLDACGLIVHVYADIRRERINIIGRLEDGRSFAAVQPLPLPVLYIRLQDEVRACSLLDRDAYLKKLCAEKSNFISFDGSPCVSYSFSGTAAGKKSLERLAGMFTAAHIEVFGTGKKDAAAYLIEKDIRAGIRLKGKIRAGRNVDIVFPDAEIIAASDVHAPLTILSLDIETGLERGAVRAAGLSAVKIYPDGSFASSDFRDNIVLFAGEWKNSVPPSPDTCLCGSYPELLKRLAAEVQRIDPDIITGWNIIDFDFLRLDAAFSNFGISFSLGRSMEPGHFFPAEEDSSADGYEEHGAAQKRSASVFLPGRQILDGLRMIRTNHEYFESYSLDTVAHTILGEGKTVSLSGSEKIAELDRLYAEEPRIFCDYCLRDAELVLDILEKRDLIKHTLERNVLTGVGIDKAWTSVASFERVYAAGLYNRGILEPNPLQGHKVSGAAGGTVLEPQAGLFRQVAVFDFRSLYPSIIRSFNIDPFAYETALRRTVLFPIRQDGDTDIIAPNGAHFDRTPGILPSLIAEYFNQRTKALEVNNDGTAYVYKILMNSFYGVLGTPTCRYARTELAGAITSFGRYCLHFARDFFEKRGLHVLYGDTDSVFVETLFSDNISWDVCSSRNNLAAAELNTELAQTLLTEYGVESFIGIRFEKMYRRFFIPRLRNVRNISSSAFSRGRREKGSDYFGRGRAKGYSGFVQYPNGMCRLEIKGMEAARSDYTPLARRFQREIFELIFHDADAAALQTQIKDETLKLFRGELDNELVFKKRLRRVPEAYIASTPPHVKVARDLGWQNRRGTVEYVWTINGPEAVSTRKSSIDYRYYAKTQILPTASAVAEAVGFDISSAMTIALNNGQLELDWTLL